MKKLRKIIARVPKSLIYILIFSIVGLIVAIVYPSISTTAMTHRASTAPGGEVLLWLLPFIAVVVVNTAKQWRSI